MNKTINIAIVSGLILVICLTILIVVDPFGILNDDDKNDPLSAMNNPKEYFNKSGLFNSDEKSLSAYDKLMIEAFKLIDKKKYYEALNVLSEADTYIENNKDNTTNNNNPADTTKKEKLENIYNETLIKLAEKDEQNGISRDYSVLLLKNRRALREGKIYDDIDRTINSAIFRAKALKQYAEALDLLFIADQMYPNPRQEELINNLYTSITDQLRKQDEKNGIKREYQTLHERREKAENQLYGSMYGSESDIFESEVSEEVDDDTNLNNDNIDNEIDLTLNTNKTKGEIKEKDNTVNKKTNNKTKSISNDTNDTNSEESAGNKNTGTGRQDKHTKKTDNTGSKNNGTTRTTDRDSEKSSTTLGDSDGGSAEKSQQVNVNNQDKYKNQDKNSDDSIMVEEEKSEYEKKYENALTLIQNGSYDEALEKLLNLLKYKTGFDRTFLRDILFNIGKIFELKEKPLKSLGYYNEALKWDDNFVEAMLHMGIIYYELGLNNVRTNQYAKAKEILTKALKVQPDNFETLIYLGKTEEKLKNLKSAIKHYSQATMVKPDNYKAKVLLADALSSVGKVNEAVAIFENALQNNPILREDYRVYLKYADVLRLSRRLDDSEKAYKKALEKGADRATVYHGIANVYFDRNNYETTIVYMKKVIAIDGEKAEYYLDIAIAYNIIGEMETAAENYKKAIILAPDNPFPKEELAKVYFSQGKIDKGIKLLEDLIHTEYTTPEAYRLLGEAYMEIGETKKAEEIFNLILNKYPAYHNIDLIKDYVGNITG
ncbi:MAG: tetratricopeptide repeat protein [Spirochaetota bacterium]